MAKVKKGRLRLPGNFSRRLFREAAKQYALALGGHVVGDVKPMAFKTGSLGWHLGTKLQVRVGDTLVWCQLGTTITVIGSKALPDEPAARTGVPGG